MSAAQTVLAKQSMESAMDNGFYLIRGLQLFVLHVSQHVVRSMQRSHLRMASADISGEADEPQAVTMPEQTLGPHLWDGGVGLRHPLG